MSQVIEIAAPPKASRPTAPETANFLLPVIMSVVILGVAGAAVVTGSSVARNPVVLAFPAMMSVSLVATAVSGRGRRRGLIDAERDRYLRYLSGIRAIAAENMAAQRSSLIASHPDPDMLWALVGSPHAREQAAAVPPGRPVRVGTGAVPSVSRLVVAESGPLHECDPVAVAAVNRLLRTHSTIDAPIVTGLSGRLTVDGDAAAARGLLRAIVCGLAVFGEPDRLLVAGVVSAGNLPYWEWLKWLPHNQSPHDTDLSGPTSMFYSTLAEAAAALRAMPPPTSAPGAAPAVVVVVDIDSGDPIPTDADSGDGRETTIAGAAILEVGCCTPGAAVSVRSLGRVLTVASPDRLEVVQALACARRLAAHPRDPASRTGSDWSSLIGIGDPREFDPAGRWHVVGRGERLTVPIGRATDGAGVTLDIREAAEGGAGPHGLCVGATGSGKSELLRTIALGMMARNCSEALNLLLIDFKGGATFLDFARAPHVAAVVTNMADEAHLVARMREALAGEINRRQLLLREAGCVSVAAYDRTRGPGSAALPALFVIVDEFSELLSQHPDFADIFVVIGRLGRSLGMHLLLASQRLDEGRLRGLEAHLSYRICLKTLSAGESRAVLGNTDAFDLPGTPGEGFLRVSSGRPVRFRAACVSAPLAARPGRAGTGRQVRRFEIPVAGRGDPSGAPVLAADAATADTATAATDTAMDAVLDRLSGQGPPAHRVWLPPLGESPRLAQLLSDWEPARLVAPIGVVDRPYEQSRPPLTVDLSGAAGNLAIVGGPRSGKSTALRTLITALAATHDPGRVQCYCLDFGGGGLSALRTLPHVGAVADRNAPELVRRMVVEVQSAMRAREAFFGEHGIASIAHYRQHAASLDTEYADIFLVIDGWAGLRAEFEAVHEAVIAIAAQCLSFGVHVVVTASRWAELRPALKDQIGTRIELRLGDPADSELDRRQARHIPADRPGRGLSGEGHHLLVAVPELGGLEVRRGTTAAPPIPLLPTSADYATFAAGSPADGEIQLGVEERRLQPVSVDFERNRHLLILGDGGCGKTSALRTLCREVVRVNTAQQARLFLVDFRRSLFEVVAPEYLAGYAMSPASLEVVLSDLTDVLRNRMPGADVSKEHLRERSWWTGPQLYLVVDDYELVATAGGTPMLALLDYLPHAADLGLHVLTARRGGTGGRGLFEPLLAGMCDLGCTRLTMSAGGDDARVLGSGAAEAVLPPGRGMLTTRRGVEQLVQVFWTPPP
ncbi:type VII secretion protein EccCb [Mycobacterium sp.]|uniref:type VII secretion protein EccCb n=1 Tax=Mycobacterium sp. TaxID=1785 RepID=UPI003A8755E9